MICEKYNCIFIHVPKTGGSSIEHALDPNVKLDTVSLLGRILGNTELVDKHAKAKKYAGSNKFKFGFVRNPWDWAVSYYKFYKIVALYNEDFKCFLENILPSIDIDDQYSYLEGVDFVGRFENLQDDFDKVCDKIGMPRTKLPHTNTTKYIKKSGGGWELDNKHYTEYYDEITKDIIAKVFKRDIEYFGYKFGES